MYILYVFGAELEARGILIWASPPKESYYLVNLTKCGLFGYLY